MFIIERVELPEDRKKGDVIIYAGGIVFAPWEIERVESRWGWPKEPEAIDT